MVLIWLIFVEIGVVVIGVNSIGLMFDDVCLVMKIILFDLVVMVCDINKWSSNVMVC